MIVRGRVETHGTGATLIPTMVVPIALAGACLGLWLLGFSINVLTLFAMVMAIGILVDDAIVVSIKRGGEVGQITIGGRLHTSGDQVTTVEIDGKLDHLEVAGGISATGKDSDAVHTTGEVRGLDSIRLTATNGHTLVRSA